MGTPACSDNDDAGTPPLRSTTLEGIPVLDDSTRGPGTNLGAGFRVAPGSALLGTVFPSHIAFEHRGVPVEDDGFSVLLLVTGDPRAVFAAYAHQAAAVGLPLGSGPQALQRLCAEVDAVGTPAPGAGFFSCMGRASQGLPDAGHSIDLELWRGPATRGRPPLSHLFLRYSARGDPPYEGPVAPGGPWAPRRATGNGPPLSDEWPPLPRTDEPYESNSGQTPLRVPSGALLVAAPSHSECGGGSMAVFRVTGEPRDVLDALSHQVPSSEVSPLREATEAGARLLIANWDHGGGSSEAQVVLRSDEPAWMMVDHCPVD